MPLCHKQLRRWYLQYNARWFGGSLPEDMDVYYVPRDDCLAEAQIHDNGQHIIEIDSRYAYGRLARWALLHEMVHIHTGDFTHGKVFQAGMLNLAKRGAFRKIW